MSSYNYSIYLSLSNMYSCRSGSSVDRFITFGPSYWLVEKVYLPELMTDLLSEIGEWVADLTNLSDYNTWEIVSFVDLTIWESIFEVCWT